MENKTTIHALLQGTEIYVPDYQRAYSWDSDMTASGAATISSKQVAVFLNDILDYISFERQTHYYLGHFIFEQRDNNSYNIIDGQQRLTTVEICISALLSRIEALNGQLNDDELTLKEDILARRTKRHFHTVDYDDSVFADYVIEAKPFDKEFISTLETESQRRILAAMFYFRNEFSKMEYEQLKSIIYAIANADCTTHVVSDQSEAVQMFIFQNARGKEPTKLEILKAKLMYYVHIYAEKDDERTNCLRLISDKFAEIYRSISILERYHIDEDNILSCAYRIHKDKLTAYFTQDEIDKEIVVSSAKIRIVMQLTDTIAHSFNAITAFVRLTETRKYEGMEDLVALGYFSLALPFIVKSFAFSSEDKNRLSKALADIIARNSIIGTRAVLEYRLGDVFSGELSVDNVINRIEWMKTTDDSWWAYWNNNAFKMAVEGEMWPSQSVKYILWRYENYLHRNGKGGYKSLSPEDLRTMTVEHIMPQTLPEGADTGYDSFDGADAESRRMAYTNQLGNYILISGSHNSSIGNGWFSEKRKTYCYGYQQREIQDMTSERNNWTCADIDKRRQKLVAFVLKDI